jgi:hypothetical protein
MWKEAVVAYFEVILWQLRGWAENITEDESLYEINNDNGATAVNFATSKYLTVKSTTFPHRNIRK